MNDLIQQLLEGKGNDFYDHTYGRPTITISVIDEAETTIKTGDMLSTKNGDVEFVCVGGEDDDGNVTSLIVKDPITKEKYGLQTHRVIGIIK